MINPGDNGPLNATIIEILPTNALEERVNLDPRRPTRDIPEPLGGIILTQRRDDIAGREGHDGVKAQTALDDLLVDAHRILVPEGGLADEEFVDEDAERPPVDGEAVAGVLDDLGGEVFRGAAEGEGEPGFVGVADLFGEAEVDEADVAVGVEEDVFGFEVAVGDAEGVVEVFDGEGYFGGVEFGGWFVESSCSS